MYELTITVEAVNEDEARAIAAERLQRNDGFDIQNVEDLS